MEIYIRNGVHFEIADRIMRSHGSFLASVLNLETAEFCLRQELAGLRRRGIIEKLERRIATLRKRDRQRVKQLNLKSPNQQLTTGGTEQ